MSSIPWWGWLVAGIGLITIELIIPAAFFIGLGAAAFMMALIVALAPDLGWAGQLVGFSLLSLVSIVVAKRLMRNRSDDSEQPLLNRRGHQYLGRNFTLEEPIVNGQGKIRVDDSTWKINGSDCEAGAVVTVVGVDGVVLQVERSV